MRRSIVTLLLAVYASGIPLNAEDAVGVVIRVLGTVVYETANDSGVVEPGMEIQKGSRFNGTLGDTLDVATRDGVMTIGAFPYVIDSPELSRSELDAYLNVIGGAAVRTRSQGATDSDSRPRGLIDANSAEPTSYINLDDIAGWPIGSLDIRRIYNGFVIKFRSSDETSEILLQRDSLAIPLDSAEEILSISYATFFSESADGPESQAEWSELESGQLDNPEGIWVFGFPEYKVDTISNGRYINRTVFTIRFRDGRQVHLYMHYRISEEAIMEYIDTFADTMGQNGNTPFSTDILRASKYQYNGYMVEALLILQELELSLPSL